MCLRCYEKIVLCITSQNQLKAKSAGKMRAFGDKSLEYVHACHYDYLDRSNGASRSVSKRAYA